MLEHINPPTYTEVTEIALHALHVAVEAKAEAAALRLQVEFLMKQSSAIPDGVLFANLFHSTMEAALAEQLDEMSATSPYLAQLALAVFAEGERPTRGSASPDQTRDEIPY